MKNKKFLIVIILVFVLLFTGAYVLYERLGEGVETEQIALRSSPEPVADGDVEKSTEAEAEDVLAPDFTVYDKDGNEVRLSDFFGKPIVLNFWASWCGPCQYEMPDFDEKYKELGSEVNFVMVNMTDGQRETVDTASAFIEEKGYSFPVLFDSDSEAALSYGAYSLPTTFFIDADGHVIAQAVGAIDADTLQRGIDAIKSTASDEAELTRTSDETKQASENSAEVHVMDFSNETENVIYLAGGCFWGIEHLMQSIPGVIDAQSGYANGRRAEDANYTTICNADTGFRETVRVEYDPEQISLDAILLAYFYVIDPTVQNRQGNDIGSQYLTGVYYTNDIARETVERISELERSRSAEFYVEIGPLLNYYPAEEYHQDYLQNNPFGYCHIPLEEIRLFSSLRIDPGDYKKPAEETIRDMLSVEQYAVTQENGTEYPFQNEFWNQFEKGIYVDIVSGEPLFSSADKFESSCGWPAFSKPIEEPVLIELEDTSHGMVRTEVRSRAGNSHLGHVFENDPESPNGVRYCINSASLRFIPYAHMEAEGYGYLMELFE